MIQVGDKVLIFSLDRVGAIEASAHGVQGKIVTVGSSPMGDAWIPAVAAPSGGGDV